MYPPVAPPASATPATDGPVPAKAIADAAETGNTNTNPPPNIAPAMAQTY